jgi:hypothetical protein
LKFRRFDATITSEIGAFSRSRPTEFVVKQFADALVWQPLQSDLFGVETLRSDALNWVPSMNDLVHF